MLNWICHWINLWRGLWVRSGDEYIMVNKITCQDPLPNAMILDPSKAPVIECVCDGSCGKNIEPMETKIKCIECGEPCKSFYCWKCNPHYDEHGHKIRK